MKLPPLPQASREKVLSILASHGVNLSKESPLAVLAVRAYYSKSMGAPGNDLGMYDDAAFMVTLDGGFYGIPFNTDPSRAGFNGPVGKPFALLNTGLWFFRPGKHKGKTPAFRQCTDEEAEARGIPGDGEFSVTRYWGKDNPKNYVEVGYYAINIHMGGEATTSSWGCQTVPPSYRSWLQRLYDECLSLNVCKLPYLLVEGPIN